MKKFLVFVVLLAVLLFGGGAWFSKYVSDTVTRRVPAVMSAVVGLPVELDEFQLGLWRGTASLRGLTVGNAEGFASPQAFSLGRVDLELDMSSLVPAALGSGPIGIRSLVVDAPAVFLDLNDNDRTNLEAILRRLPGEAAPTTGAGGTTRPTGGERPTEGKTGEAGEGGATGAERRPPKIRIGEMVMSRASFQVSRAGDDTRSGTLEDIRIENVGGDTGVTAVALSAIVVSALARETLEQALELVVRQEAEQAVDRAANKLLDKLRKKLGD